MKKPVSFCLFILFVICTISNSYGQSKRNKLQNPFENKGDINSRFDYVYKTSSNYLEYRVILKKDYRAIQNNVRDSLTFHKENTSHLKRELNSLKQRLNKTSETLNETKKEKDSMPFFGVKLHKKTYHLIMILVIVSLIGITGYFVFKYLSNFVLVRDAKRQLSETQKEFETHQKGALKRQQVLNRKLQDERLKNKKNNPQN